LPRQVRAGLPKVADSVCARAVDPNQRPAELPLRSPSAFLAALRPLIDAVAADTGDEEGTHVPLLHRSPARWALRIGLLAAVAALGWTLGLVVGRVPGPAASVPKTPIRATPSPGAPAQAQPIDLTTAVVSAFDPAGKPPTENDQFVPQAFDGDPSTGWQTETYYGGPNFGGLKTGVGLLVDLTTARGVREVDLTLPSGGATSLELRAAPPDATAAPAGPDGFRVVAQTTGSGSVVLRPTAPVTSRFWLVWITSLPKVAAPQAGQPAGWQAEIDEMSFVPS
jgi:hypothetical protein